MKTYLNYMLILALIFSLASNVMYADFEGNKIDKDLPMLLGSSSQGTEFVLTFHPCWETANDNNENAIYVVSATSTTVTLEIPALRYKEQITTTPNKVSRFTLSPTMAQMYSKTDKEEPAPQQVYSGRACIVTADDPIICYGITNYAYTSDGYLALPSSGLGREYIVSSWNDPTLDNGTQFLTSYTSIVSIYDNTVVEFTLGGEKDNYTPGANSLHIGDKDKQKMQRGDVWLIGVNGDYNDLSGSHVKSDKPVAVISGSFCAYIPVQTASCDFIIEQELPMETWGKKYHITPIIDRQYASYVRIYAAKPNTDIFLDGKLWDNIGTVGGPENTGFISRRLLDKDSENRPVVISANNPISITQYNPSSLDDGINTDPFQMVLTPMEQYEKSIISVIPDIQFSTNTGDHYINLCYKSTEAGLIPNDMEYGIMINDNIQWAPLNQVVSNPGVAFNDPEIVDGKDWKALTIHVSDIEGLYAIRGNTPFVGYGYGVQLYTAYGWRLTGFNPDNGSGGYDVQAPSVTYTMNCVGDVIGQADDEPRNNDDIRSNFGTIGLVESESYNYTLSWDCTDFVAGETSHLDWALDVMDPSVDAKASLYFTDRAGNEKTIVIEHKATTFSMNELVTNWERIKSDDAASTKTITLFNLSDKSVNVGDIILKSQDDNYDWSENGFSLLPTITFPITIQAGDAFSFDVMFDPAVVQADFLAGKTRFIDYIAVKADWSDEYENYCYYEYIATVKATVNVLEPTLLAPANDAVGILFTPTFKWSSVGTASSYQFELATDANFTNKMISTESATTTYTTTTDLEKATTYYWHVKAIEGSESSIWSETWSFKTRMHLAIPVLIAPTNKSVDVSDVVDPTFIWTPIEDATGYKIIVATDSNFGNILVNDNSSSHVYTPTQNLSNNTTYYWQVMAFDTNNNNSAWSDVWSFSAMTSSAVNDEDTNTVTDIEIQITPNPATDNISISDNVLLTSAKIYDILGNLVLEAKSHKIDVSQLSHGTYVVVIETETKAERAIFIKE